MFFIIDACAGYLTFDLESRCGVTTVRVFALRAFEICTDASRTRS